jgi:hypothetical protein
MPKLIKRVFVKKNQVYKVEINFEMAESFEADEATFWENYSDEELDWEFSHDKVDEDEEYEIEDE